MLIPIAQLFAGRYFTIHGTPSYCFLRLELFDKKGVISRLCHNCFTVQILPLDVVALVQIYFAIRGMDLPWDNYRKCMVELREDVAYPYKGYIFCESVDEAKECLTRLRQTLSTYQISNVYCGISHGCSEYGLKYPKFKFSEDGSHQSFERPVSWDQTEAEFFSEAPIPQSFHKDFNHKGVTLRDVIAFRTWVDYAEIIGDHSCKTFRDTTNGDKPEPFATRIKNQSRQRRAQMADLGNILSSVPVT